MPDYSCLCTYVYSDVLCMCLYFVLEACVCVCVCVCVCLFVNLYMSVGLEMNNVGLTIA